MLYKDMRNKSFMIGEMFNVDEAKKKKKREVGHQQIDG